MQDGSAKPRHKLYGGIAASVALHVVIAAVLFARLPAAEPAPPEDSVSVELVPPPEEQPEAAPEPEAKPEEQALNLTMPDTKPEEQKPEIPEPPEPPKQEAEEAGGEPPPPASSPPPPAEQAQEMPAEADQPKAQADETQAQQDQALQEQAAAEPPPPPEAGQAVPEQPSQPEPGGETEQADGQPLPVLRPVFEFGEEDSGSGPVRDGNASQGAERAETPGDTAEPQQAAGEAEQAAEAATGEEAGQAPAPALPQDVSPPTIDAMRTEPLAAGESATADGVQANVAAEPAAPASESPAEGETGATKPPEEAPLKPAKRLFSQSDTGDMIARTAMGSVPREARGGQLCSTELTEQLRNGSPPFYPDIVPSFALPDGTVLDVRHASFRARAQWYDVKFRCEVDRNATRVVSFALEVGEPVPRSEWKKRGFPEF